MDLFDDDPTPAPRPAVRGSAAQVEAADPDVDAQALAARLPATLHMGTSSWSFPGWRGLVWRDQHTPSSLSRHGLTAYSRHPLLRCVSLDRSFYRPLSASEYAGYAAQVPDDFRFVVKAPSTVCDAVVRGRDGRGTQDNPAFLDPVLATREFVQPAIEGLGHKIGALVFQLSPLPQPSAERIDGVLARLSTMLACLPDLRSVGNSALIGVEVRNPEFLSPAFVSVLKASGTVYCMGLHPRMPPIGQQLPLLRALWPAPLVCRWSLNRNHGPFGYEDAKGLYEPFDRLHDPDPATRKALAQVIAATTGSGLAVYITINNKAEGSAPLSVFELAREVELAQLSEDQILD